mmetsp:Transcript_122745/g.392339  ORF Transcript_122745/g.392339 Transcript_122745/m.392339 type:complete len:240 (-) Transcript_122745:24-743(-)
MVPLPSRRTHSVRRPSRGRHRRGHRGRGGSGCGRGRSWSRAARQRHGGNPESLWRGRHQLVESRRSSAQFSEPPVEANPFFWPPFRAAPLPLAPRIRRRQCPQGGFADSAAFAVAGLERREGEGEAKVGREPFVDIREQCVVQVGGDPDLECVSRWHVRVFATRYLRFNAGIAHIGSTGMIGVLLLYSANLQQLWAPVACQRHQQALLSRLARHAANLRRCWAGRGLGLHPVIGRTLGK